MRWPWSRRPEPRHAAWQPPAPIPDGDVVLGPGQRRWADLLQQVEDQEQAAAATSSRAEGGACWLAEPTRALPVYRPLLTPGQAWRTRGGGA